MGSQDRQFDNRAFQNVGGPPQMMSVDPNQPTKDQQFRLMAAQLAVNLIVGEGGVSPFTAIAEEVLKFLKG